MRMLREYQLGRGLSPKVVLPLLQSLIRCTGYRGSRCDWTDNQNAFAFSFESWGPSTYGAPKATASYNSMTGWIAVQY